MKYKEYLPDNPFKYFHLENYYNNQNITDFHFGKTFVIFRHSYVPPKHPVSFIIFDFLKKLNTSHWLHIEDEQILFAKNTDDPRKSKVSTPLNNTNHNAVRQ